MSADDQDWFTTNAPMVMNPPAIHADAPTRSHWADTLFAGGLGADTATTIYGLSHGYHEANPLYNFAGDKAAVPVMLGIDALAYVMGKKLLEKQHPKMFKALLAVSGGTHGAAALKNLQTFRENR